MAEFDTRKRDLQALLNWLEKNKEREALARTIENEGGTVAKIGKENIGNLGEEDRVKKEMAKRKTR